MCHTHCPPTPSGGWSDYSVIPPTYQDHTPMSYELPAVIFETADRRALRHRLLLEDVATNANSLLLRRMTETKVKPEVEHHITADDIFELLPDKCPDCPRLYKKNPPGNIDQDIDVDRIRFVNDALDEFRKARVGQQATHRVCVDCPRCGNTYIPITYVGHNEPQ